MFRKIPLDAAIFNTQQPQSMREDVNSVEAQILAEATSRDDYYGRIAMMLQALEEQQLSNNTTQLSEGAIVAERSLQDRVHQTTGLSTQLVDHLPFGQDEQESNQAGSRSIECGPFHAHQNFGSSGTSPNPVRLHLSLEKTCRAPAATEGIGNDILSADLGITTPIPRPVRSPDTLELLGDMQQVQQKHDQFVAAVRRVIREKAAFEASFRNNSGNTSTSVDQGHSSLTQEVGEQSSLQKTQNVTQAPHSSDYAGDLARSAYSHRMRKLLGVHKIQKQHHQPTTPKVPLTAEAVAATIKIRKMQVKYKERIDIILLKVIAFQGTNMDTDRATLMARLRTAWNILNEDPFRNNARYSTEVLSRIERFIDTVIEKYGDLLEEVNKPTKGVSTIPGPPPTPGPVSDSMISLTERILLPRSSTDDLSSDENPDIEVFIDDSS